MALKSKQRFMSVSGFQKYRSDAEVVKKSHMHKGYAIFSCKYGVKCRGGQTGIAFQYISIVYRENCKKRPIIWSLQKKVVPLQVN